jgi:Flp pilus assembly pilin Flp
MSRLLKKLHQEEAGQDLIEYALIGLIISLAAIAAMTTLASSINQEYTRLASGLPGTA